MLARSINLLTRSFAVFKEALSGNERDYTQGGISKAVVLLAIPMILELSLESVFAVVDMFFVGKLGRNAIASVGLTESVITIIYSVAIGLSTAATAIVARRIGEKNPDGAAEAGAQSITIAIVLSIFISIAGIFYAEDILLLMGAGREVVSEGAGFTRIMIGGSLAIMLLFLINGIFRGAGDAAMAMRSLWIASGINIVLCPVLVHYFGLKGAAIATVIGRSSGVVYQCWHLFGGKGLVKFSMANFKTNVSILKSIFKIAWPATFQFVIASGSWIVLIRLVAETGGTAASAGYQIAFRNFVFFILPSWGLSNAAATLVGQNLGAKKISRAQESVYVTARYSVVLMGMVMLLFLFASEPIVRIFSQDEEVVLYARNSLRIIGSGYIFYGLAMVMTQALNGAGDTKAPTIINFICFWLFQVPFAYLLAVGLHWGASGVVVAIPVAQALIALLSWYYFNKGNWKTVQV